MSMNLERQDFAHGVEYLIAGATIPVTTGVKEAAADLKRGAPVLLNGSGKAAKVTATTVENVTTTDTEGLYGIAADDAESGEDVVVYLTGEFFAEALVLEENVTAQTLEIPFRNIGVFLK